MQSKYFEFHLTNEIDVLYNINTGLDGELAVPCNLQSAIAGSNSCLGANWSNMCTDFW